MIRATIGFVVLSGNSFAWEQVDRLREMPLCEMGWLLGAIVVGRGAAAAAMEEVMAQRGIINVTFIDNSLPSMTSPACWENGRKNQLLAPFVGRSSRR